MIGRVHEVSIAVRDLDAALENYRSKLGVNYLPIQEERRPPISARFVSIPFGECSLALMESLEAGDAIDRFISRRGEGIFSITMVVEDIHNATEQLREAGVDLVLDEPLNLGETDVIGVHYNECLVNFTSPRNLNGVVFEIRELRGPS